MSPCHFSGSGRSALTRRPQRGDAERELAGPCSEKPPLGADDVTEIEGANGLVDGVTERLALCVDLKRAARVLQNQECGPPERANRDDSTGDSVVAALLLYGFALELTEARNEIAAERIATKVVGKRAASRSQRGELLAPDADLLLFLLVGIALGRAVMLAARLSLRHRVVGVNGGGSTVGARNDSPLVRGGQLDRAASRNEKLELRQGFT